MIRRADAIDQRKAAGDSFPIWQSLAAQGVAEAQYHLGNVYTDDREAIYSPSAGILWYRRAVARGSKTAMYNLAVMYRNQGNMRAYRSWLARAAQFDDDDRDELRQFRQRFPHAVMRRWRRYAHGR